MYNATVDLKDLIAKAERFVEVTFARYAAHELPGFSSAHDWFHTQRVRSLASLIAQEEGADADFVDLVAVLHDLEDRKFSGSDEAGPLAIEDWLGAHGAPRDLIDDVVEIVRGISYKGEDEVDAELTLEGQCVRDADRLDALGTIGIARAFVHGGRLGQTMYDPSIKPTKNKTAREYRRTDNTTVNHFYEKTLLLAARMTTSAAQRIAQSRHADTESFLRRFKEEWDAEDARGTGDSKS